MMVMMMMIMMMMMMMLLLLIMMMMMDMFVSARVCAHFQLTCRFQLTLVTHQGRVTFNLQVSAASLAKFKALFTAIRCAC